MGWLARRLFGISLDEVRFTKRGFRGGHNPRVHTHIETIGESFLGGYHAALEEADPEALGERLDAAFDDVYRGFAYEGAGMSLALIDALVPGRRRFAAFLAGVGEPHVYMLHVGAGWAMARLPVGWRRPLADLDPLLAWLAYDGWGFHQGYFHWPRSIEGPREVPRRVRGYARRAFDQGLGRSLWFVEGTDVERVPRTIGAFPAARQADLWAGIGLASTYAGGVSEGDLQTLFEAAGEHRHELSQGASFAAKARQRAGNPTPHTELACQLYCQQDAATAAAVSDRALENLPPEPLTGDGGEPAFEVWRQRIRQHFVP